MNWCRYEYRLTFFQVTIDLPRAAGAAAFTGPKPIQSECMPCWIRSRSDSPASHLESGFFFALRQVGFRDYKIYGDLIFEELIDDWGKDV